MKLWLAYGLMGFLLLYADYAEAQTIQWPKPVQPSRQEIYTHSTQVSFKLSPAGMQFGYRFGQLPNFYTEKYYQIEVGQIRHPKEMNSGLQSLKSSISRGFFKNYTYGKQNSLFTMRASQGKTVFLSDKISKKNVLVGYSYRYGISAGLIKPYYIQVVREGDGITSRSFEDIKYTEETREVFLNDEDIFGKAPFRKGLGEMTFTPGIHAQGGMHFDWSKDERLIMATEVGLMMDFYFTSIPLMVDQSSKPFFLNLYVSLQFGKRK
ncbi:MAG TPA: hypothetical protein VKZ56_07775 [Membranihabitans sp.]|nr:hypothetical protein [Membranihabitans sp.]